METKTLEKTCDIVVVGAGHAGCEASLACARLGLDTVMFTVSVDSIASVKDAEQFQGTGSSFTESTGRQTGLQHRDEKDSGKSGKSDH